MLSLRVTLAKGMETSNEAHAQGRRPGRGRLARARRPPASATDGASGSLDSGSGSRSRVARFARASRRSLDLDFSLGGRDHYARAVAGRTGIRARHPVRLPQAVQPACPSGAVVGHAVLRVSLPDVPASAAHRECAPQSPTAHLSPVRNRPDRYSWRSSDLTRLRTFWCRRRVAILAMASPPGVAVSGLPDRDSPLGGATPGTVDGHVLTFAGDGWDRVVVPGHRLVPQHRGT